jgi:hypothetical protein
VVRKSGATMTAKEIKKQIRELKRKMKKLGIRRISFMNAGLSQQEYRYNEQLFRLKLALERAVQP